MKCKNSLHLFEWLFWGAGIQWDNISSKVLLDHVLNHDSGDTLIYYPDC